MHNHLSVLVGQVINELQLLRFDLNGFSGTPEIESAKLKVLCHFCEGVPSERNLACYKILQDWDGNSVTWSYIENSSIVLSWNVPGIGTNGIDASTFPEDTQTFREYNNEWVTFDVKNAVIDQESNPRTNFGFLLKATDELSNPNGDHKWIPSSEHYMTSWRPQLEIVYFDTPPQTTGLSQRENYTFSHVVMSSGITTESGVVGLNVADGDVAKTVTYTDKLGRKLQVNSLWSSPAQQDFVAPIAYDALGRKCRQYMPYPAGNDDGLYHVDAVDNAINYFQNTTDPRVTNDTAPYSETVFETSPLSRVLKHGAPGANFQPGTGNVIHSECRSNIASDNVQFWSVTTNGDAITSGVYTVNELAVVQTTDENGTESYVYTDKSGNEVLKKTIVDGGSEVQTYYVYDERNNLRFIIPPEAVNQLSLPITMSYTLSNSNQIRQNYVTYFVYDGYDRLVEKYIPEAKSASDLEAIYTIYDRLGRMCLTQDGNLRVHNQWLFIKYDMHGRHIMSGLYTDNTRTNRIDMQVYLNSRTGFYEDRDSGTDHGYTLNQAFPVLQSGNYKIHQITYYDDYDFNNDGSADKSYTSQGTSPYNGNVVFDRIYGKVTGTKTRILSDSDFDVYYNGGNYSSWPSTKDDVYIHGDVIRFLPGFQVINGQTLYAGAGITIPPGGVGKTWNLAWSFYDKHGRVIQSHAENHLNGVISVNNVYDFVGKLTDSKQVNQTAGTTFTVNKHFTYDHAGRLKNVFQQNNQDAEILLASHNYNELGQLIEKNLHSTDNGQTFLQSVDYSYHIRSWLTCINDYDLASNNQYNDDADDLFGMRLNYEEGLASLNAPVQYNGNISAQRWRTRWMGNSNDNTHGYGYDYDDLNRLTDAKYAHWTASGWSTDNSYSVSGISYDDNGNIESLTRNGAISHGSTPAFGVMDNLAYQYIGNRLIGVNDAVADIAQNNDYDFSDNTAAGMASPGTPSSWEYEYDINGNMTSDANKSISVSYNYLNLPEVVDYGSGNRIEWVYNAGGAKLRKTVYNNSSVAYIKDYTGGAVYTDQTLDFFHMDEGRVKHASGSFSYEYFLKDHLGNTRVAFTPLSMATEYSKITQEDHYYPFGMRMAYLGASSGQENKFLYNGKELEDDLGLNWYHYGARYYDPQVGRWHVVDPVDEFFSPYLYCGNDPIRRLDPDGMDDIYYNEKGTEIGRGGGGFLSFDWLFGDNHFMVGADDAPHEYIGKNFWPIECAIPEDMQGNWNGIINYWDEHFDFVEQFAAEGKYPLNLQEVRQKSPSKALWDFKRKLDGKTFYLIGNKGYLRDFAGNYTWATVMANSGWPVIFARLGAGYFQTFKSKTSCLEYWLKNGDNLGDDPRDTKAINMAYKDLLGI
ncbi:DNRLRE domain-containing protein [bacterium]|nr:DNRLRE domain-containing protein [bacterium]